MSPILRTADREPVEVLRASIRGRIPDSIFALFCDYVDCGEAAVGLETLFDELEEKYVPIGRDVAGPVIRAALDLKVDRFSPAEVYALVANDDH